MCPYKNILHEYIFKKGYDEHIDTSLIKKLPDSTNSNLIDLTKGALVS